MSLFLLAIGGVFGALSRYHLTHLVQNRTRGTFPAGTFFINLTGSFALGVLAGVLPRIGGRLGPELSLLLGTGFCGAYTTFSSFGWECVLLWRAGRCRATLLNLLGQPLLGSLAAWLGLAIGMQIGA